TESVPQPTCNPGRAAARAAVTAGGRPSSTERQGQGDHLRSHDMATPRRLAALLAASAIAIAACGSNDGGNGSAGASTAPGQSAAPASQAPAVSTGTVSGELTVWGMGNEGAKLDVLAKDFMAKNPDVMVNVTPVDWGQA